MSIFDKLGFRQNAKTTPPTEKPRYYTVSVEYNTPEYFQRKTIRSTAEIERNLDMYYQGGIISTAIDTYPQYAFMNLLDGDIELMGEEQTHVDIINEAIKKFDFTTVAYSQFLTSLLAGDGVAEIVKTRGIAPKFHSAVCRNPKFFDADVDSFGTVVNYKQIQDSRAYLKTSVKVPVDNIWHVKLMPRIDSPWGLSLMSRSIDEIIRDTKTAEGIANGIERHGTPKWNITVGSDDEDVSDDDLKKVAAAFQNVNSKNEVVHRHNMTIDALDNLNMMQVGAYDDTSLTRVLGALGVPIDLFIRDGASLATSNKTPKMDSFEKRIKFFQTLFNSQTDHQLFRRILLMEGETEPTSVRINFGDISPERWVEKADAMQKMMPAVDPFLVYQRDEIREKLGDGPYVEDVED